MRNLKYTMLTIPQSKTFGLLFLFTFLFMQNVSGQDYDIDKNWHNLKTQFKLRNDIIKDLVTLLSKSSGEKKQLDELQMVSVDFFNYVDTLKQRDSLTVSIAKVKNEILEKAIEDAFLKLEDNKRVMNKTSVLDLITQLESSENKITVAKAKYNEACNHEKRTDLLFGRPDKVPVVRF
ncbi:MAG TPA: LemA family protein [Sphingobacteriaceae bacterium]